VQANWKPVETARFAPHRQVEDNFTPAFP